MSRGDTQYFLEVERILVDQQLKAAQERACVLRSRATGQRDTEAAERATAMTNLLITLRRRLNRL